MSSLLSSTMLTANDAILGWSPSGGDDEDINVSQDMFFMKIQSLPCSYSKFLSPNCPPLGIDVLSPTACPLPSESTPLPPKGHAPIAPSSNRRAQRNRHRDPSWIPRPRNAFIIFRCQYSREHSQGSQDVLGNENDEQTNASVKTLSKRAAEAWKQLPVAERERYKALADKEREEHARLYPHYRFRPMKRQASGTRKPSMDGPKGGRVASAERPAAPSVCVPSVLAPAPVEKPGSSTSLERVEVVAQVEQVPFPEPSTYPTDAQADVTQPQVSPQLDYYNDPLLFYSLPEPAATTTGALSSSLSSDVSAPASVGPYAPLRSISLDAFRCHDSTFGLDQTKEDLEQAQALEAYSIGLYNFDLFSSSFPFPEYC